MNCKGMSKIMPEFAAGELPEAMAQEAEEHVKVCKTCCSNLERYRSVLDALGEPREILDVPDALSHLHIPGWQPRSAHRFRWAAVFCLAIGLICAGFWPKPHQTITTRTVQIPPKAHSPVKMPERIGQVERVAPKVSIERVSASVKRKSRRKRGYFAWKPGLHSHTEHMAAGKPTRIDERKPEPMVVIACILEDPPSVEIERYDRGTGVHTEYVATYEDSGELTGELEIKTQPKN